MQSLGLFNTSWHIHQSVHITHTYCCVSKLSKFGAYLYAVNDNTVVYINNTFLPLNITRHAVTLYYKTGSHKILQDMQPQDIQDLQSQDITAPDKLRICVFYAIKISKNACIIRSECTHYAYILLCKQTLQIRRCFSVHHLCLVFI
jgi:hypothetical protein